MVKWTAGQGIRLIVDESFADFADEADSSVLEQELLERYSHLWVMKSISKSYGVPGLRLGVLASGDEALIAELKKDVAIWNINSFAEFYLQIEEKYRKSYVQGLELFKAERARYINELSAIKGLRIIPSQANYVMAELTNGMTAERLTRRLLVKHNILIKNLNDKLNVSGRHYVRLAIRNTEENKRLAEALRFELEAGK